VVASYYPPSSISHLGCGIKTAIFSSWTTLTDSNSESERRKKEREGERLPDYYSRDKLMAVSWRILFSTQ
jgi:hypothetical protein